MIISLGVSCLGIYTRSSMALPMCLVLLILDLEGECRFEESFEAYLCRPEGEFIMDGVQCYFLLLYVAGLSVSGEIVVLLEGVDSNLFFLLADRFGFFLHKIKILEQLHLLIHDPQPEPSPHLTGNADVVDSPANWIDAKLLSLTVDCSW